MNLSTKILQFCIKMMALISRSIYERVIIFKRVIIRWQPRTADWTEIVLKPGQGKRKLHWQVLVTFSFLPHYSSILLSPFELHTYPSISDSSTTNCHTTKTMFMWWWSVWSVVEWMSLILTDFVTGLPPRFNAHPGHGLTLGARTEAI